MLKSTRSNETVSFCEATLKGLADDHGLYVFTKINPLEFNNIEKLTYNDVAKLVFHHLIDDIDHKILDQLVDHTYNDELFSDSPAVLKYFSHHAYLNLYQGQTLAFKDVALSMLPNLIKAAKDERHIYNSNIVLTATSGDTGSAALAGFSKNKDDHIIVLYPNQGVSLFQEKQMHMFKNDHTHLVAINGNFDDCQSIVKKLFQTVQLNHMQLTSANSINIGRIISQIVYYVYTYVKLIQDKKINKNEYFDVIVPTGNFGNIYAAYIAKQMGIKIDQLTVAANSNDVLHEFFTTGYYKINRSLLKTYSPSMDIIISSNLERYLYTLLNEDENRLKNEMSKLTSSGSLYLDEVLKQTDFKSGSASESDTLKAIKDTFLNDRYLIDPHTAVAKHVYTKNTHKNYTVIVSTASPYKFVDAMNQALELESKDTLLKSLEHLALYANQVLPESVKNIATYQIKDKEVLNLDDAYLKILEKVRKIDEN